MFPRERVAVFEDGNYWHARLLVDSGQDALDQRLARLPEASRHYWRDKFSRRVARDQEVTAALSAPGWLVVRIWESDAKRDIGRAAGRVAQAVRRRRRNAARSPQS